MVVAATAVGALVAVHRIGVRPIVDGVVSSNPSWVSVALSLMCLAMAARAVAWRAILSAALPDARVHLSPVLRATSIGVLVSAVVPARIGEPARVLVMARHLGTSRSRAALLPVVLGTTVSQTVLNLVALAALGALMQLLSCYALLAAFGLEHRGGVGAAAAVLFAVNVSAAVPVTPSNLGVFQAACVAVLSGAYGVHPADALGYGIVLQTVEIATAVVMGAPALLREGLAWKDLRGGGPPLAADEAAAPPDAPSAPSDRP